MKNRQTLALGMLLMLPLAVQAQENIQRAFNALIHDSSAQIGTTHKVNRDPETNVREGQLDAYTFTVPLSKRSLVENVERAFDRDRNKAYSLNTVSGRSAKDDGFEALAVGGSSGYMLGDIKGSNYIYALFLDPEDTARVHRYAYAMEWVEHEQDIQGKLVVTYATTQKFRESGRSQRRTITINGNTFSLGNLGSGFSFDTSGSSSETWLTEFNTYKNLFLKNPSSTAASSYATQIYKLCKHAQSLEQVEKNLVGTEILKLKKATKDEFVQHLFDMCNERLKQ